MRCLCGLYISKFEFTKNSPVFGIDWPLMSRSHIPSIGLFTKHLLVIAPPQLLAECICPMGS